MPSEASLLTAGDGEKRAVIFSRAVSPEIQAVAGGSRRVRDGEEANNKSDRLFALGGSAAIFLNSVRRGAPR